MEKLRELQKQNILLKEKNKEYYRIFKELKQYILKHSDFVLNDNWYFTGNVFDLLNILDQIKEAR